ncbi:radical SAM protein [Dysosmobacter sp.]|uniref:radical SAM protein n=1 Tax=Dysosmobacter sp. TaxID=2591382 RepID=UPI002A9EE582|nr:radical SAM protein [Dysosmobacter sp.]MDY5612349.1 radical SAM protein [Dysosmobacter sp.]
MSNAYQVYSNYLFAKAGSQGIPLSGTFELTARCNLDCRMCYIHKRANDAEARAGERTAEQWLELAKECQEAGTLLLLLTGGEPFLRPDFREIYSGCRKLGLMVSINSNATLINEDMIRFLAADPPSRINITLYGASPETYGALCGDPPAYERVVRAILGLQAAGVLVKLNFSVTPYNRQDLPAAYQFARDHNLHIQAASYMFPPVRACEHGCFQADRLTPEESARAQLDYDSLRFPPEELRPRLEQMLAGGSVPDPDRECQELPTERIRCRAGSSTFWVTWDGQLRPCGMMTTPTEDLRTQSFRSAWTNIRSAREQIMVPPACSACPLRGACDQCSAICYAETGAFTAVPEYMCQRTRAYLELARKWLDKHGESQPEE